MGCRMSRKPIATASLVPLASLTCSRRLTLPSRFAEAIAHDRLAGGKFMSSALPITLIAAGGAALINFWLSMRTGNARRAAKVSIGDGGDPALIGRMRAQANFIEYTPIVLILIGAIELSQGSSTWLWAVTGIYLLGRVGHALGMDGMPVGRFAGTITSLLTMLGLGIYALIIPFTAPNPPVTLVPVTVQQPAG